MGVDGDGVGGADVESVVGQDVVGGDPDQVTGDLDLVGLGAWVGAVVPPVLAVDQAVDWDVEEATEPATEVAGKGDSAELPDGGHCRDRQDLGVVFQDGDPSGEDDEAAPDGDVDQVSERLVAAVGHPGRVGSDGLTALVRLADEDPAGFRLLSRQEPEFQAFADHVSATSFAVSEERLRERFADPEHRAWAARLLPALTVEAITAWLDAGRPGSVESAAATVQQMVRGVMAAIAGRRDGGGGQARAR